MVVLNYLNILTCLRNGRFWWEDGEISQNALAFMANVSNRKRNSRNFPFDNFIKHKLLHTMGQNDKTGMPCFDKCQTGNFPFGTILSVKWHKNGQKISLMANTNYVTKNRFD